MSDTLNGLDRWKKVDAYVEQNWRMDTFDFHFRVTYADMKRAYVTDIVFEEEKEDDGYDYPPGLRLRRETVQYIMNQLWSIGFRPADGVASAGQTEAMQQHIDSLEKDNDRLHEIIRGLMRNG